MLDGHNFLPYLTGAEQKGPRNEFFYFSDDGKLLALRDGDWKVVVAEQRAQRFDVWRDPFVELRAPSFQPAPRPVRACRHRQQQL